MTTIREQVRSNLVAIVSLLVAFSALGYNTWRNERTEHNRNVRTAGIELLKEIGSLQQIIFYAEYVKGDPRGELRMGWADMLTINDLAAVMPPEVAVQAENLRTVWEANAGALSGDTAAFQRVDGAIEQLRQATLASLRALR